MENWILVKNLDGNVIKVRQHRKYGDIFVDENGKAIKASHLDFTEAMYAFPEAIKDNHFDELKDLMKSWDIKEQDNNRAMIAEREYWRKLRGDIFLELLRKSGLEHLDIKPLADDTDIAFNAIYEQDSKFFADKMVFNVPIA